MALELKCEGAVQITEMFVVLYRVTMPVAQK